MVGIEASKTTEAIIDAIADLEKVKRACKNIDKVKDLPDAFHKVHGMADLAKDALERAEDHVSNHDQDEMSCEEMKLDAESCKQKANSLREVFRRVVSLHGAPILDRYREVARDRGGVGKNRVETLMIGLLGDTQNLVAKCVIERDGKVTQAVAKDHVEELAKAIEELSAMPPSLVEDTPGNSVANYGSGTVNANTGDGTQNNNTGSGKQYIGHTQHFKD